MGSSPFNSKDGGNLSALTMKGRGRFSVSQKENLHRLITRYKIQNLHISFFQRGKRFVPQREESLAGSKALDFGTSLS